MSPSVPGAVGPADEVCPVPPEGTALVVDDDRTNRLLLQHLLHAEGFHVELAADGEAGVALFERCAPDIVFMDVVMPHLDGYEAARRIKALSGRRFVPVVFLTALSDDETPLRCMEAGGDDFIHKPFRPNMLRAKLASIERIRRLYQRQAQEHDELATLHAYLRRDHEIAERIYTNAISADNVAQAHIQLLLQPASTFSGDILLSAYCPDGGLNVLVGDFTGHGLAATIGALPASQVFRAMTAKGFPPAEILREINDKLLDMLPTGMFLCATLLSLDLVQRTLCVWNGGLPQVLVLGRDTGRIRARVRSTHIPLGIQPQKRDYYRPRRVSVESGDRVVVCSDGLLEARDPTGEMFGESRLIAALEQGSGVEGAFGRVVEALERFRDDRAPDDDITLAVVPCESALALPGPGAPGAPADPCVQDSEDWRWALALHGQSLRYTDPVRQAMAQVQRLHNAGRHRDDVYVVLSELYSNALDHGVLGLGPRQRGSPEALASYHRRRERRLSALGEGSVQLELEYRRLVHSAQLIVRIKDSGRGFDHQSAAVESGSGGIARVRSLCESLSYRGRGNRVEAVYAWT